MSFLSPKTPGYLQAALDKLKSGGKLDDEERYELEVASKLTGRFGIEVREAFKKEKV